MFGLCHLAPPRELQLDVVMQLYGLVKLVYNCAEDVRTYIFASFDAREELIPSDAQLKAAEDTMAALDLTQGAVPIPFAISKFQYLPMYACCSTVP